MERRQQQALQRFRRVRDFLERTEIRPALGELTAHIAAFNGTIDRLTTHQIEQDVKARATRAGTESKGRFVRDLRRQYLRPIAQAARVLFPDDEVARKALAYPRTRDAEGLVGAALAMAETAEGHKEVFLAHGFSEDFVTRLSEFAKGAKGAIDARARNYGQRSASTAGVRQEIARGVQQLRLIDLMVQPVLETNVAQLAEWRALLRRGLVGPAGEREGNAASVTAPPSPDASAA